ncbi:MAG: ABC transporter permease [Candidatus Thiodiazotropha lotti]|uniref:ABC transporter permease n=1 Tax=Candidatus Thiodiazotropha endoloripes TaxID=1818881 RepID=A0A1E2UT54_9GAMM|nr:ABC transporter permease [Candidatus Thiodiazotropha weberae]MCG7990799.1 ABC transporter permease [Candidatus Thiodiazotropha lotti]ODB85066.1 ABC transporter permease [Candidatus Thiodiazotropha endoloripes]MCG7901431.1 ABC transporter permease [Candidatus Thiodiazotropha weberae]MCG7913709.1 ABC transporter permease [Candidatus Thiodiazotropha weberae]
MIRYWFPLGILAIWTVAAITGGWVVDSANQIDLQRILMRPGDLGLMGYDDLGRPILQRIWVGAQVSLLVSFGVVSLSLLIGTAVGLIAGYQGGWLDLILVRVMDVFLAFPGILLAIALAGIMGPGVDNLIIALSAVGWVGFARLTRGQVLSLKQRDHVTAAIALGTPRHLILLRHLLPLLSAPLIVEATFGMAGMVIAEAGLSFLGLGIQPPDASWGSLIRDGASYMLMAPHMVLAPGVAIMLVVLSLNMLGDRLRDRLDHRSS